MLKRVSVWCAHLLVGNGKPSGIGLRKLWLAFLLRFFLIRVVRIVTFLSDTALFLEFLIVLLADYVKARVETQELLPADVHL